MTASVSTVAAPAARTSAASSRRSGGGADFAAALDGALTQASRRPEERPDRPRLSGQDRADERRTAERTDRTDDAVPVRDRSERPNWVDDRSARGESRSAWAHTRAAAVRRDRADDVRSGDAPVDVPAAGGAAAVAAGDATAGQPGAPLGVPGPMANAAWALVLAAATNPAATPVPSPAGTPAPGAPGLQVSGPPPVPGAAAPTHEPVPGASGAPGTLPPTATGTPVAVALAALARAAGVTPPPGQPGAAPTTPGPTLPAMVVESGTTPTSTPAPGSAPSSPAVPTPVDADPSAPGVAMPGSTAPGSPAPAGGAPVVDAAAAAAPAAAPDETAAPAAPGSPAAAPTDAPADAVGAGATVRTTSPSAAEPADAAGTSPSVGVAPAGGTSAAVPVAEVDAAAPPRDPEVASQLARQLAVLRHAPDGTQTMTVHVTPDELGPVSIEVTVSTGALELTLRGAHDHGRAALIDAVPDLRRELEAAGLSCTKLDVDRDPDAWSGPRQDGRPDPSDGDPRGSGRTDARTGGEHGSGAQSGRDDARRPRPVPGAQPGATPLTTAGTEAPSGVDIRV